MAAEVGKMASKPVPEIKGLPIIGIARSFIEEPADYLVEQVQERDIVFFRLFGMPVFTISAPELIHEVLVGNYRAYRKSDRATAVLRRFIGEGLVTYQDFDEHRQQRRLAQPAFHMRRVAAYADVMVDYAARSARH
jgi:cytochrome P450